MVQSRNNNFYMILRTILVTFCISIFLKNVQFCPILHFDAQKTWPNLASPIKQNFDMTITLVIFFIHYSENKFLNISLVKQLKKSESQYTEFIFN